MKMTRIEIKNRFSGEVIFALECDDNTIAQTVQEAVRRKKTLRYADLRYADLRNADLSNADLRAANLHSADLSYANLHSADLRFANLHSANLSYADLHSADLRYAVLHSANLSSAENVPHIRQACPTDGAFIGWKKVKGHLIKLEIPDDAERSSGTTNKCRCDKALVVSITNIKNGDSVDKIDNDDYAHTEYVVGQMVFPDRWDDNRFNECSHGIHFFIDKQDAINY